MSERDPQREGPAPAPAPAGPGEPAAPTPTTEPAPPDAPGEKAGAPGEEVGAPGEGADPYAGLDEVTRAKRRLLDYGAARDAERRAARRRPTCTAALAALGAGFTLTRFPGLRRALLRGGWWAIKRVLTGKPTKR